MNTDLLTSGLGANSQIILTYSLFHLESQINSWLKVEESCFQTGISLTLQFTCYWIQNSCTLIFFFDYEDEEEPVAPLFIQKY